MRKTTFPIAFDVRPGQTQMQVKLVYIKIWKCFLLTSPAAERVAGFSSVNEKPATELVAFFAGEV